MAYGLSKLVDNPYANDATAVGPTPYPNTSPEYAKPTLGEFSKGLSRATQGMQADLYGAASLAGNALGNQGLQQFGDKGYARNQQEAADPSLTGRVESIYDVNNLTDAVDWALGGLGSLAPTAAVMLAGGVSGGILGRGITQANRAKGTMVGAAVGATAPNVAMQSGGIFKDIQQNSGIDAPLTALGYGTAGAALDLIGPASLLRKTGGKTFTSNVLRHAGISSVAEGTTEAGQEALAMQARASVDPSYTPFDSQNMDATGRRLVEAGALGALGGGVLGGIGGAVTSRTSGNPDIPDSPFVDPVKESPAASLSMEDKNSKANLALSPVIDAFASGAIDRPAMQQQFAEFLATNTIDEAIVSDMVRRIQAVDSTGVAAPSPVDTQGDTGSAFGDELKQAIAEKSAGDAFADTNFDSIDQTAAADAMNIDFGVSKAGDNFSPSTVMNSVGLPIVGSNSLATAVKNAQEQNPDIQYEVLSGVEATKAQLKDIGIVGEEQAARIKKIATQFAEQSDVKTSDPVGWLGSTFMLRSVRRIPSQVTPVQEDSLSGSDLQASGSPADLRKRRKANREITRLNKVSDDKVNSLRDKIGKVNADFDPSRGSAETIKQLDGLKKQLSEASMKDQTVTYLKARVLDLESKIKGSSILSAPQNEVSNSRSIRVQNDKGQTKDLYLPGLVRRMMQNESTYTVPTLKGKIKAGLLTGLSSLLVKGYKIPAIPMDTVVHHSGKGKNFTYAEILTSDEYTSALLRLQNAEEMFFDAQEALNNAHNFKAGRKPSDAAIRRIRKVYSEAQRSVSDAKSQVAAARDTSVDFKESEKARIEALEEKKKKRADRPKKSKALIDASVRQKADLSEDTSYRDLKQGEGIDSYNTKTLIQSRSPAVINGHSVVSNQSEDLANVFIHPEDQKYLPGSGRVKELKKELSDIKKLGRNELPARYRGMTKEAAIKKAEERIVDAENKATEFTFTAAQKYQGKLTRLRNQMAKLPAEQAVSLYKKFFNISTPMSRNEVNASMETKLENIKPKYLRELQKLKNEAYRLERDQGKNPSAATSARLKKLYGTIAGTQNELNKFLNVYIPPQRRNTRTTETPAQSASLDAVTAVASKTSAELKKLDTPARIKQLQTAVTTLTKNLGIKTKVQVLSVTEALAYAKENGFNDYIAKMENGTLHGFTTSAKNGVIRVFVHPGLTGKLRNEILAHEFGHVVFRSLGLSLSSLDATAIGADFKAWATKHGRGTAGALLRSKKTAKASLLTAINGLDGMNIKDLSADAQKYLLDFEEYFADNVSKWVIDKTATPKTAAEKFFHSAVQMLKKIAARLGIPGFSIYGLAENLISSSADFSSVFSEKVKGLEKTLGSVDKSTVFEITKDNAFALLAAAKLSLDSKLGSDTKYGIGSILNHLDAKTKAVIDTAMKSPAIKNQVAKFGKVTPELAFQMWQAGKLKAGPKLQSSFKSVQEGLMSLVDNAMASKQADKVFEKIQSVRAGREAPAMSMLEFEGLDKAVAKQEKAAEGIMGMAKRFFFIADERLRATNVPSLVTLANSLHVKAGLRNIANTMDQDKEMNRGKFDAAVRRVFNGKDKEHGQAVLDVLHNPDTLASASPTVRTTAKKVFQIMRSIRDYTISKGVAVGDRGEQYFPWVFDTDKLDATNSARLKSIILDPRFTKSLEEELAVVNKARKKQNKTLLSAEQFANQILEGIWANDGIAEAPSFDPLLENDPGPVDATPTNRFMNRRFIDFIRTEGTKEHKEFLASMMSKDLGLVLSSYIGLAVKKAEYTVRFDIKEDSKRYLPSILEKAKEEGATDAQIELAIDYVNSTMGVHGRGTAIKLSKLTGINLPPSGKAINTKLQKSMGAVMVYQNIRLLVGATFSSLIDPLGIAVRSGDFGLAFQGFKEGMKSALRSEPSIAHELAETLGVIDYNVVNEALGWEYGGVFLGGKTRKINEGFFKWTGLQGWTRITRVMATSAALKFIARHKTKPNKHSQRYLDELNISAKDILLDSEGGLKILTYTERRKASKAELARDDRVRSAVVRFVDESILRPSPSQRPLWASDPHYMLAFHLKSFMYSFHDRILKRVAHEAKNGNYSSMVGLFMMVPVMIAADLAKDILFHGTDGNPRKNGWGPLDYIQNGIFRSGIPGVPGLTAYDIYKDYQYGSIPGASLLGPTVEQVLDPDLNKAMPVNQVFPDVF